MRCPGGNGPGIGEGGEPDEEGENCAPLGNVIIIQESDIDCKDVPDDVSQYEHPFSFAILSSLQSLRSHLILYLSER